MNIKIMAITVGLLLAGTTPARSQDTAGSADLAAADTRDEGFDEWGLLGLLGLAGLLGLKRRDRDDHRVPGASTTR